LIRRSDEHDPRAVQDHRRQGGRGGGGDEEAGRFRRVGGARRAGVYLPPERKDPSEITVYEIYADDDASTKHRGTEHMAAFASYFGSLFDPASVKIERLERIAGFSR